MHSCDPGLLWMETGFSWIKIKEMDELWLVQNDVIVDIHKLFKNNFQYQEKKEVSALSTNNFLFYLC